MDGDSLKPSEVGDKLAFSATHVVLARVVVTFIFMALQTLSISLTVQILGTLLLFPVITDRGSI
jgi:hypothetical protein